MANVQFYATNPTTPGASFGPGKGSFSVWSAAGSAFTPAQVGTINGKTYPYYAQSTDGSQWEQGSGVYNSGILTRATITWTSDEDALPVNFSSLCLVSMFPAIGGFPTTGVFTVATLPSASGNQSVRAMVTDATVTTFASVVVGGGSNIVPVFCDGTSWRIG